MGKLGSTKYLLKSKSPENSENVARWLGNSIILVTFLRYHIGLGCEGS